MTLQATQNCLAHCSLESPDIKSSFCHFLTKSMTIPGLKYKNHFPWLFQAVDTLTGGHSSLRALPLSTSREHFAPLLLPLHSFTKFYQGTENCLSLRGMVKNLPLLWSTGNNGRPWVHAVMCDNTYSDICMIIQSDSCFNFVKSANRYQLHMNVRRTTRAYNGTRATKGLFIMCPSANMIRIKDKLILMVNGSGIYFWIYTNRQQNLIIWDRALLHCGKERTWNGSTVY